MKYQSENNWKTAMFLKDKKRNNNENWKQTELWEIKQGNNMEQ